METLPATEPNGNGLPETPTGQAPHARGHMVLPVLALSVLFLVLVARAAADPSRSVPASVALTQSHTISADISVD